MSQKPRKCPVCNSSRIKLNLTNGNFECLNPKCGYLNKPEVRIKPIYSSIERFK